MLKYPKGEITIKVNFSNLLLVFLFHNRREFNNLSHIAFVTLKLVNLMQYQFLYHV